MPDNESFNGTWHTAAKLGDVSEGEPHGVEIAGHAVALYRVGGEFYATGNICSHAEALLSDGLLDGCEIECPLHMGRFDIRSGEALTSPVEIDIPTYPVRVAGDSLEVCLPD
jgi:naphthalene 1,2-dioxygenase system ferredoxin subunit